MPFRWVNAPLSTSCIVGALPFALGLHEVAMVRSPIQLRANQPFAAESLGSVLERQVRRDDRAHPSVGRAEDVEQEFRPGLAVRHVDELVEEQETGCISCSR